MTSTAPSIPTHPPSPSSSSSPLTPTLAADLRLRTLTHLVHGPSTYSTSSSLPALVRLTRILTTLSNLTSTPGAKPISRLLDDWESYSTLLHPLSDTHTGKWEAGEQASYLLTLHPDLLSALSELESIDRLVNDRKVLDSDRSKALSRATSEENRGRLKEIQQRERAEGERLEGWNGRLIEVVRRWSEDTQLWSEAFTALDGQVRQLEMQLARLERETHAA